jgi:hypothetical protein
MRGPNVLNEFNDVWPRIFIPVRQGVAILASLIGPKMRGPNVLNEFNDVWPRIFIPVRYASSFQ